MKADDRINFTGIYRTTILQQYGLKTINSIELFYESALRNFYLLATRIQLQCSLAVETDFVT